MHVEFIVLAFVGILLPLVAPFENRRIARRIFWAGFLVAFISAFFIAFPPDWKSGIGLSLLVAFLMLLTAYFSSPHIKIRGKIYAFHVQDGLPDNPPDSTGAPASNDADQDPAPDSYGGLTTAKKYWRILIFMMLMCSLSTVTYIADINTDRPWIAVLAVLTVVVAASVLGYGDAIWDYPVARGQRVQFVIVSLVTAGVFTIFYLGGYYVARRWPLRRKQSMEYRAHPRHQKKYP